MKKDGALMTYAVWVRASKPYERIHGKPSKCHRTLCKHWTHSFMLFTEVKNLTFNFVFSSFNRSSHIFLVTCVSLFFWYAAEFTTFYVNQTEYKFRFYRIRFFFCKFMWSWNMAMDILLWVNKSTVKWPSSLLRIGNLKSNKRWPRN